MPAELWAMEKDHLQSYLDSTLNAGADQIQKAQRIHLMGSLPI